MSGRYTVVLSVSVNMDSGVTTTLYNEYDATVTLTTALPYEYRLSRSSTAATANTSRVSNEAHPRFRNTRQLGYGDADLTLGSVYYYQLSVCNDAGCAAAVHVPWL